MAKERARKKSFQQSLEDIKERMKEKRNKRLARASAPRRALSKMINNNNSSSSSVVNSIHTILKGVQQNNKELAIGLQAEKEKGRQANAVILQLKREQQALFLHLLLLKKRLKEQEALALRATETQAPNVFVEPTHHLESARRKPSSQNPDNPLLCQSSPICADLPPCEKNTQLDRLALLPSTVGVRRRHGDRGSSSRRSERVRAKTTTSLSEGDPITGFGTLIASPIRSDQENTNPPQQEAETDLADPVSQFQHYTPEPEPPKNRGNQQRPSRKRSQQQPRTKPVPPPQKAERGRKADRAPMKKPWENPKPRARSKSRDRSATRAQTSNPPQGNKLNSSLGFNDTFDFDCEEAVHLTPFRAKAEDDQPATAGSEEAPHAEAPTVLSRQIESSSSSAASESEDSLYVPQKSRGAQKPPDETKVITTRRGRRSKVAPQKEIVPPKQKIPVFRDEKLSPKAADPAKKEARLFPDSSFSNSPHSAFLRQGNPQEPPRGVNEKDCLLPVSPLVEVEMMRIDNVLSNFGDSSGEAPPLLPHQTPQRIKTCKKRGLGLRTAGRGLSLCDVTNLSPAAYRKFSHGDARSSTPAPSRKRSCTMVVDYKEPTLNAKLRRGDKFTDLQFLRSPIFKQKPGRRSVQKARNAIGSQQPFDKYNESFVGCR
uniref:Shugoshin C-terminal domain-containing protein n=1 Tax=Gasterosteus aculeatus aculeatus TaxID=481459 RepID=G3NML8_GASAC|nr:shugoshin 1 isoform X1 [Gasterosteus aculeatus aculeatus]XP_040043862.1 shugoshin 1 isoform X1 [Gasterosteus aculeatus aculeatus]XP_040043863.1 shugoshin 1 isoform X1 [Gasterosteus aculeatus aculeatus]